MKNMIIGNYPIHPAAVFAGMLALISPCGLMPGLSATLRASEIPSDLSWLDPYNVTWTSPSDNSAGSMPVGGGDIGLNVWVENGDLLLYIDRSGNIDENDQQLKSGRLRVRLDPNPFIRSPHNETGGSFRQSLNLRTGRVEIEAASAAASVRGSVWVEVGRPVVHIELEGNQPLTMTAGWEVWRNAKRPVPRTLSADGKVDGWDYNRWSMFGYFWYQGDVHTYPDHVSHREAAVEFMHRNDNSDLIFDKEVKIQRLEPAAAKLAHPTRNRIFGGLLAGDGLAAAGTSEGSHAGVPFRAWLLRSAAPQTRQHLRVFLHTARTPTTGDWRAGLDRLVQGARGRDAEAWRENQAWWQAFWNRSRIIVNSGRGPGDPGWQVGRNYQLMRYLLASNVRGEWPTRFNGGLFTFDPQFSGGWTCKDHTFYNPDYRAWGAWTAQNQRLLYWPMLRSGDFDAMLPQFEFYRKNLPNAEARTRLSWNIPGASFCEQIGSGGLPLGSHYGWEPPFGKRDPKKEMGLSDHHPTYYTTALEFAYMIHEWHRYNGGDLTPYLPLLKQVVIFHFEYFPMLHQRATGQKWDPSGKAVFDPTHALETYRGRNATDVLCALRRNLECLLALPDSQITTAEREMFRDWLNRLPDLNFRERQGRKVISPVADDSTSINNYELPQLYPVYPWGFYGLGQPDLQVAIDTWHHGIDPWTKDRKPSDPPYYPAREFWWGWTLQAATLARLGLTGEAKDYVTKKLADARGNNDFKSGARMRFPAFWGPGFDWTPDHNWGGSGMIALQEMALQTTGDELRVLPAWPKDWNLDFKLHAPGNTVVECVYHNGKVQTLHVTPDARRKDLLIENESAVESKQK